MVKHKTDQEKKEIVHWLDIMTNDGYIELDDSKVSNVRDFCTVLGIGSASLYEWKKKFGNDEPYEMDLDSDVIEDVVGVKQFAKFGIGFYMWFGRNLDINPYRINIKQLKLKIGMKLIRESGLVDTRFK